MRLISARIKGLKGIYSKSGVKEIFIDFNKSIYNLIYIIGKNGSGKSTLLSVLHPLPDPPTMFIDKELGEEELVYDNNGTLYHILIQYPVYANGNRATTKAFFTKTTSDGNIIELNPNGTIGSYKDIVFSEFCLDPNFISLSYLSVEDRGIVEKPPRDRKKIIADLLESIEVYNDIYKTLTKRSGVFKSMISSIVSKIDSIGDESSLSMNKIAIENRLNELQQKRKSLDNQIAESTAAIKIIDPNGELQSKYKKLFSDLNMIKDNITMISSSIVQIDNIPSLDIAVNMYTEIKEKQIDLNKSIEYMEENLRHTMSMRAEDASAISAKSQKILSLTSDQNIEDLSKLLTEYRRKIYTCENIFNQIGISGESLTTDEFKLGIEVFNTIRESITNIKSYASMFDISNACEFIISESDVINIINTQENIIKGIECKIDECKVSIRYYTELIDRLNILSNRPETCTDDTCAFIKRAIEAQNEKPLDKKNEILKLLKEYNTKLETEKNVFNGIKSAYKVYTDLKHVLKYIHSNASIISKFPISDKYLNDSIFIRRVSNGDVFNDIVDLSKYAGRAALFSEYMQSKEILVKLEAQEKILEAQRSIIDDIQKEIDELTTKLNGIDDYIKDKNDEIYKNKIELEKYNERLATLDNIISSYRKLEKLEADKKDIESQISIVSDNIKKISKEIHNINICNSQLSSITKEIDPLIQSQNSISYSLAKLAEYKIELDQYNAKQNTIELIKKYSSPTRGGIQTVFMQLYMDKTLNIANDILKMMFDGTLELLPYVINETEFRIPVKNNITNLIVDDVSNCSTSEKSMIAMIMGCALGFHGSREYNILRLDEIDGGLDQYNRSMFPVLLSQIMKLLNIEQCFIISHSSDSDLANSADIISLTQVSNESIKGNVIFQL